MEAISNRRATTCLMREWRETVARDLEGRPDSLCREKFCEEAGGGWGGGSGGGFGDGGGSGGGSEESDGEDIVVIGEKIFAPDVSHEFPLRAGWASTIGPCLWIIDQRHPVERKGKKERETLPDPQARHQRRSALGIWHLVCKQSGYCRWRAFIHALKPCQFLVHQVEIPMRRIERNPISIGRKRQWKPFQTVERVPEKKVPPGPGWSTGPRQR